MLMQLPIYLFLLLWVLAFILIAYYYASLRYRGESTYRLQREVRLWVPIVVAMFAALLGYAATREATSVSERTTDREGLSEITNIADAAVQGYVAFLSAVSRSYTAAINVGAGTTHVSKWRMLHDNPPSGLTRADANRVLQAMESALTESARNLADRLTEVATAFEEIQINTLARRCYGDKWRRLQPELQINLIAKARDDELIEKFATDYTMGIRLIEVAVNNLRLTPEVTRGVRFAEDLQLAARATTTLGNDDSESYQTFVLLGNIISTSNDSLFGTAVLMDLLSAVPNQKELGRCLTEQLNNNSSLQRISEGYQVQFNPLEVAPSLFRWSAEMEDGGFEYVLQPVEE